MDGNYQIKTVLNLLEPMLIDDLFLVEIKVKPVNNIKIFLDADSGLGIEKCIKINRRLYRTMEEMELYPEGDFSLEVSSPGLSEPLKMHRQYLKNIGREVEVTKNDDSKVTGELKEVTEENITLTYTEGKGKKAEVKVEVVAMEDVKQTIVQINFK